MKQKIRMGVVGGGAGAFIGDVHRRADACVATSSWSQAFSEGTQNHQRHARGIFRTENRVYTDYERHDRASWRCL